MAGCSPHLCRFTRSRGFFGIRSVVSFSRPNWLPRCNLQAYHSDKLFLAMATVEKAFKPMGAKRLIEGGASARHRKQSHAEQRQPAGLGDRRGTKL